MLAISAARSILLFTIISLYSIPQAHAMSSADTSGLSPEQVKRYITSRVATNKLQQQMRANAAAYDDLIEAFYAKRKELLERRGWTVGKFEATQERIMAVITAMEMQEKLPETLKTHKREITAIRSNENYSDEQKAELIEM